MLFCLEKDGPPFSPSLSKFRLLFLSKPRDDGKYEEALIKLVSMLNF